MTGRGESFPPGLFRWVHGGLRVTLIDLGTGSAAEPASLADIKSYCRIDRADEDGLIGRLAKAARLAIEARTGLALVTRSFRLCLDPVPRGGWVTLPRRPLEAVTSVTAFGVSGAPTAFDEAGGIEARTAVGQVVRLSAAVLRAAANGVEIEFRAGWEAEAVPADIYLALLQVIALSYEARGLVEPAAQPAGFPASAERLIAPFRTARLA
jgi:uncharacterized phiE125 gp8 family phage protein